MNKKSSYLLSLIIILNSCQLSQESNKQAEEKANDDSKRTVKIIAQSRPFGEAGDYDMPIDKGLETLQIVSKDEVDIDSSDLVMGLIRQGQPYAIPIKYLSGFEVANLYLGSENYLLQQFL